MKIFADLHHSGLFYSLHLLLEKRLGHELYRPLGMNWFTEGFWDIAKPYGNNEATAKQYLEFNSVPEDGTPPLNNADTSGRKTPWQVWDKEHEYWQKIIGLEEFKNTKIDVIIASIPDHAVTYKILRDMYQPQAKLIFQMGNMFNEISNLVSEGYVTNLMASTIPFETPANHVFYYQEQPLPEYVPTSPMLMQISSFVHLLPERELYEEYKKALVDFEFRAYGAGCPDGWMNGIKNVYKQMQNSAAIWHVKPGGDGYGWNWHSAFICARPIITRYSDYKDKLGGLLFEDLVTGIDLDRRTAHENQQVIRKALVEFDPKMGDNALKKFQSLVNYEAEATKVKLFLEDLK